MKTLAYSIHGFDKSFLEKAALNIQDLSFTEKSLNNTTAILAKGYDAISIFTSNIASSEVLEQLNNFGIKFIALRSVGYDHVDLLKAKQLGIKVGNVPAYSPYAIAEHTVALLMALNRKIVLSQELIQKNDFRLDKLIGFDLHGKTVGIVGTGKIGAVFAKIMNGFGCKLLGYDVIQNNELVNNTPIKYTSLEELCKTSDIISVSCPLNNATKYLFNKNVFSIMKKGVVFINTARGGIVNTKDLLEALNNQIVSCAALDVYENEKPIYFNDLTNKSIDDQLFIELRNHPNVIITGHQAFLTNEALQEIASCTINNLTNWEFNNVNKNDLN